MVKFAMEDIHDPYREAGFREDQDFQRLSAGIGQ
jgi:hypothetical protein